MAHPRPSESDAVSSGLVVVVTTVDDETQARSMARSLVEQGLAACVQISPVDSVYRWEGVLHEHREWQLSCKVSAAQADRLQQAVLDLHPYDVPMLYTLLPCWVHSPYRQWVEQMGILPHG